MKVSFDFLCIDERDSPNLAEFKYKSRSYIKNVKNRRFFGLCGVIIPGNTLPELNLQGRKIQERCFGKEVFRPFHYVDILNCKAEYAHLGKDLSQKRRLTDLLNNFAKDTTFKIIASFIDKQELALKYGEFQNDQLIAVGKIKPNLHKHTTPRKINLYEIALKHLITDYYKYLSARKKRGIIISEARGEVEDKQLLNAFYSYQRSGAGALSGKEIRKHILDLLIIRKSQNHIGLQLADLIMYPLYDNLIPNHSVRNDHFIRLANFEKKVESIKVFPT